MDLNKKVNQPDEHQDVPAAMADPFRHMLDIPKSASKEDLDVSVEDDVERAIRKLADDALKDRIESKMN